MRSTISLLALLGLTHAYVDVGHLLARQTSTPDPGSDDDTCLGAILEVAGSAPFPPTEIVSHMTNFFMTATGSVDYQCGWQTALPGSLVDDWNSYQKEVISWYSKSSAEVNAALSKCPPGYESSVGPCSSTISGLAAPVETAAPTGTAGSGSGSGSGGSGSGSGSGSGTTKNAAKGREMGVVGLMGAVAAGFLGVVVAL
ncbi:hypothetical protein OQA88_7036 [Cercophora sp. LCS_1]